MSDSTLKELADALLEGDLSKSEDVSNERIVTEGIEVAMEQLDAKCTVEEFNLLEIMLSGRAVMAVIKELFPSADTVVIAALVGDVHDLGKNILKAVLTAYGYRVVDCGKDCPLDLLINSAEEENALAIGISGLISTVIPQVRRVRGMVSSRGLVHVKVVAGGAVLKQSTAHALDVDYVAQTSFDGLRYLNSITKDSPAAGKEDRL